MKKETLTNALSELDPEVIDRYFKIKQDLEEKKKPKSRAWIGWASVAACLVLLVGAAFAIPALTGKEPGDVIPIGTEPFVPLVSPQTFSAAPRYYGTEASEGASAGANMDANPAGISVTAKVIEVLPDTYTFFDDWRQTEYRLARMKTVKLLAGAEMTEEFFYLIPEEYSADLSAYACFVIRDMAQFGYEDSVMYNKTQGKAEILPLVLLGYRIYGYDRLGEKFLPFDADGKFDGRLWGSSDEWKRVTAYAKPPETLAQAENEAMSEANESGRKDFYIHLLKDVTGEAADVLKQLRSFEDGLFVPMFRTTILSFSPEVQLHARRYIDGFATNEMVSVWGKEWTGGEEETVERTNARFTEDDLAHLPDLPAAFNAVTEAVKNGTAAAPHYKDRSKIKNETSGVFGWYAKTDSGVIGIVRVTWCFTEEFYQMYFDDAYYVIEPGADACERIDRDALLDRLGECESAFVIYGDYDSKGRSQEMRVYA